jgi:uncharacterized protein (UPF0210 family)
MRIRSVTIGANMDYPVRAESVATLGPFQKLARNLFAEAGLEVQTVRLATQPFPEILQDEAPASAVTFARELEALCQAHGIDYCSIGTIPAASPDAKLAYADIIPEVIRQTEMTFASMLVALPASGINLDAITKAAEIFANVAHTTPNGFGNLRFAVLANCGPGSPFFPAAYHQRADPSFSIATEAADLAVDAFTQAATLDEAHDNLRTAIEERSRVIQGVCHTLAAESGLCFGGIDFSLAPYPEVARSIGHALEKLGVEAFGASSTLFAVAFTTRVIREAQFPRCGFSGLFLPVLEDSTLAQRSGEDLYTLDSLLLYSAVCGTGLDTIPLPGDVSAEEMASILLDVATLALVADKPLTARLMPIPGGKAGDVTDFDFPYFANARILDIRGRGGNSILRNNQHARL